MPSRQKHRTAVSRVWLGTAQKRAQQQHTAEVDHGGREVDPNTVRVGQYLWPLRSFHFPKSLRILLIE